MQFTADHARCGAARVLTRLATGCFEASWPSLDADPESHGTVVGPSLRPAMPGCCSMS